MSSMPRRLFRLLSALSSGRFDESLCIVLLLPELCFGDR